MNEPITVRCVCGWESAGPTEDVIAATSEHGQRVHNMSATREQILAMAVATPAAPSAASSIDPGAGGGAPRS
jgi:hypothetical protein